MHINIFVSQRCFVYCKGCYSYSREEKCDSMLSTSKIIDFLKYIYKKGVKRVTFCGGDPLTREDIIELLSETKTIGFNISLDTLGSTIIEDRVVGNKVLKKIDVEKLAKYVDVIGIPIDGSSSEIISGFRITKEDIFNKQLKVCEELHKYNATICINTVVHKKNLSDAKKIAKVMNKLDYIKKWQAFQYIPIGKFGYLNRKMFEISEEEYCAFKECVLDNYKYKDKIQFKDAQLRNKAYMLVDNSGNAWVPDYEKVQGAYLNKRTIIGNITNKSDWEKIYEYLK